MGDELLPYYERELSVLRGLAAEFAEKYPKIAGRLTLGQDESKDPHVERLLQAFAFLTSRVHCRLDDDFPELTDSLLGLLYPHYLQPIPSMSVVEFSYDPKQAAVTESHHIPRGTYVETEQVEDDTCLYRTCCDVNLLPVKLMGVRLSGPPFRLPVVPPAGTAAVLRLTIETLSEAVAVSSLPMERLRFYIHSTAGCSGYRLYELLLTRATGIVVWAGGQHQESKRLPADALQAAGFDDSESALHNDGRSFSGYRLLSEFFAFPQKFVFFDLIGLTPEMLRGCNRRVELAVVLDSSDRELERSVSSEALRLGCAPIVNSFQQRLDPVRIDGRATETCIVPDARRPYSLEVHSISAVRGIRPGGEAFELSPFLGSQRRTVGHDGELQGGNWIASRRSRRQPRPDGTFDVGTDTWISIIDDRNGTQPEVTLSIEALCGNRNMPSRLPFSVGRPRLHLRDGQGPVGGVVCLVRPTRTLRPQGGKGEAWRLVSHLSLNHLSLVGDVNGSADAALRDIFRLYLLEDLEDYEQRSRWIDGIVSVVGRPGVARVPGALGGVCRGLDVMLELDDESFIDGAGYLFASVIERFLGAWVSINSFTRLAAGSPQRKSRNQVWRWPPRSGGRVLV